MMKIFVIEYLKEKERDWRRHFWENLRSKFQGRIEITLCSQVKHEGFLRNVDGTPFDLTNYAVIFIHDRDKRYAKNKNYVDLAKKEIYKPFVCYSAGVSSITAPNLPKFQVGKIPLDLLHNNIEKFLDLFHHEGALTLEAFYSLVGIDSQFDAAIELLQMFLPLDIELQLRDAEECKRLAGNFDDNHKTRAANLLSHIKAKNITVTTIINSGDKDSLYLLKSLWKHAEKIQTATSQNELDKIFGFELDHASKRAKNTLQISLNEDGFHRVYERLRDNLLTTVEEKDK